MEKPTLLLFAPVASSLVIKDAAMFSSDYTVRIFTLQRGGKLSILFRFILQFFFLLKYISRAKIMVSRFVGYQTVLPVIFSKVGGKPLVCIMGGLECIKFPSVKTGSYTRPFFGRVTKWCLKNSTHLCPVHDSLVLTDYTYQDEDYPKQGYKYFVPDCNTPVTVIRNGYESEKWKRTKEKIPNSFITVAHGIEQDHLFLLKGIDLIAGVVSSFPQCRFTIVGGKKELLEKYAAPNLHFTGEVANDRLHDLLSTQEFYLQLSITEGFPNALCEAMLCECIPIGSNVGAIPEIINDDRLILKRKDPVQLKTIVDYALSIDRSGEGLKARKWIKDNYPVEKRKESFQKLFTALLGR
jgi:glycosyltransferase involved in cell wall biosynthesis